MPEQLFLVPGSVRDVADTDTCIIWDVIDNIVPNRKLPQSWHELIEPMTTFADQRRRPWGLADDSTR